MPGLTDFKKTCETGRLEIQEKINAETRPGNSNMIGK